MTETIQRTASHDLVVLAEAIEVIDKGAGIPEKYRTKIFDRFFRIPDQEAMAHGSGLGLFICKQIVQAHGGTIQLISKVGEGSNFRIFLPTQL